MQQEGSGADRQTDGQRPRRQRNSPYDNICIPEASSWPWQKPVTQAKSTCVSVFKVV